MNDSKNNSGSGGAHGAGSGLRGGKSKQVALRRNDSDIESRELDPNRGAHDKPIVWSHGPYVMIRPARGPGVALRRGGTSSRSRVYGGDLMTNLAGSSDTTTTIQYVSKNILDDNDDDFNEDFDDDDDGGGDGDGRELIERQEKRIVTHNASGGGRGRGRGSRRENMARNLTGDDGRGSEQVNSHGSTEPLHKPSDDEDEPVAIGRGPVAPPLIPAPENRIWIWVENDE
ncbi:uncharacterized protein LOC143599585 [Bidens hawaiensis]|uniref:uncharacterized protein LOC143599585 n=1 Tax=Bidens hawaiensis TaxID=980011 RepID=UPI00404B3AAE